MDKYERENVDPIRYLKSEGTREGEGENKIVKLSKIIITKVHFNGKLLPFELMTTNSES